MKHLKRVFFAALFAAVMMPVVGQNRFDIRLWQDGLPNDNGVANDSAVVRVFLPDAKKATGRAVVICPGGSYAMVAIDHEGYNWAPFFNNMGIAAIVLRYRMPHGVTEVPISDAEEAMRLVRRNAEKWNINPDDIGIMGSSAGGHLASTIATHSTGDAKPNFQILFYPVISMQPGITHQGSHDNLLGKDAKKKQEQLYCNEMQVTRLTPRAYIDLTDDDTVVLPINGVNYYTALYRNDVPATLHVYPSGGHGYGAGMAFKYHAEMLQNLKAWLESF